jgi:outer membrane lipoprotein
MRHPLRLVLLFAALLLGLVACASGPKFDTSAVDKSLVPTAVAADIDAARGRTAMWGGAIINSRNYEDTSQLEVLAYPLTDVGRPQLDQPPLGRFLVQRSGYLETVDYAPGRLITAIGPVAGVRSGTVGEARYNYPVIEARQLHLWPRSDVAPRSTPQFHFGIGIGVIR